jgi:hypothetical protein
MALLVRRVSAVKLVGDLTAESPVSADYPVGTVDISGDRTDESRRKPGCKRPRWPDASLVCSARGQAKRQVVAKANRSQASITHTHQNRIARYEGKKPWKACVFAEALGKSS